jgi:hypothetical protein
MFEIKKNEKHPKKSMEMTFKTPCDRSKNGIPNTLKIPLKHNRTP